MKNFRSGPGPGLWGWLSLCLQGDCEDHATLLCSLLLGFGLDAYVCVGTNAKGAPHAWVLTRGCDGTITFWESLTAQRLVVVQVWFALDSQATLITCPFFSVITPTAACFLRYLHRAIDPDAPPLAPQPKASSPYRTVGCVFNHQSFLANCQPSDAVNVCLFDFQVVWCLMPWYLRVFIKCLIVDTDPPNTFVWPVGL